MTNDDEVCIPSLSSILLAVSLNSRRIQKTCGYKIWNKIENNFAGILFRRNGKIDFYIIKN